ncbi:hypothetical protein TrVE_jg11395 [Triparma verrucosa]|uniref:GTPase Der n=1 Tax=Triparma verrucosa TaxID=1606542 RepID=A0A9W7BCJ5_9STRA|nr:hypothetical protein TrVE_jg11395 [Triparma verrucosa]
MLRVLALDFATLGGSALRTSATHARPFTSSTQHNTRKLQVAVVGPPNAGKSTLFNRFLRGGPHGFRRVKSEKRKHNRSRSGGAGRAIVSDVAGTTRDRRECVGGIGDIEFKLFDTAGVDDDVMGMVDSGGRFREPNTNRKAETVREEIVLRGMAEQTLAAVDLADVILFLFDGKALVEGGSPHEVVDMGRWLRKNQSRGGGDGRVVMCANKLEGDAWAQMGGNDYALDEIEKLGFGEPIMISAEHGDGMADLASVLLEVQEMIKEEEGWLDHGEEDEEEPPISVAILGRQNVGKSTLLNRIIDENRVITGSVAGLTRDAIAVDFESETSRYSIVDTAGIRKAGRREADGDIIEDDSVREAMRAMKLAHVCILVLEGEMLQLTKQELSIADHVIREGRALIVVANKSDTLKGSPTEYAMGVKAQLDHMVPHVGDVIVVATSALHGEGVENVLPVVEQVYHKWNTRIQTAALNQWLKEIQDSKPPPSVNGRRSKMKFIVQPKARPPTFRIFANVSEKDMPENYIRYLRNEMRKSFGMEGMAIRIGVTNTNTKNPYAKKRATADERRYKRRGSVR